MPTLSNHGAGGMAGTKGEQSKRVTAMEFRFVSHSPRTTKLAATRIVSPSKAALASRLPPTQSKEEDEMDKLLKEVMSGEGVKVEPSAARHSKDADTILNRATRSGNFFDIRRLSSPLDHGPSPRTRGFEIRPQSPKVQWEELPKSSEFPMSADLSREFHPEKLEPFRFTTSGDLQPRSRYGAWYLPTKSWLLAKSPSEPTMRPPPPKKTPEWRKEQKQIEAEVEFKRDLPNLPIAPQLVKFCRDKYGREPLFSLHADEKTRQALLENKPFKGRRS